MKNDKGWTQIPNPIMAWLAKLKVSNYQMRILMLIIRNTFGWHKEWDEISKSQFAKDTGIHRRNVHKILKELIKKKLIDRKPCRNSYTYKLAFNETHGDSISKCPSTAFQSMPKSASIHMHTKEKKGKERDFDNDKNDRVASFEKWFGENKSFLNKLGNEFGGDNIDKVIQEILKNPPDARDWGNLLRRMVNELDNN